MNIVNYHTLNKIQVESLNPHSISPFLIYLEFDKVKDEQLLLITPKKLEIQLEKLKDFLNVGPLSQEITLKLPVYVLYEKNKPIALFNSDNNEYFAPSIDKKLIEFNQKNPDSQLTEEQLIYKLVSEAENKSKEHTQFSNWAKSHQLADKLNDNLENKEVGNKPLKL